jgi:rhodanese-related sulfurtransferase
MLNRPIPTVDVQEASRRLAEAGASEDGPLLVDVREADEYLAVRADGARLFPLSQFVVRYQELPMDRPLLMICAAGGRSGQATAFLLANGWEDVANIAGGTGSWVAAGLPTRTGAPGPDELERGF